MGTNPHAQDAAWLDHLDPERDDLDATIPVHVVGDAAVHQTSPRTLAAEQLTVPLAGTPARLAPRNLDRRRLTIRTPAGSAAIFVAGHQAVTPGNGFAVLATDPPLVITTTGEVWACQAAAGTDVIAHVLAEYDT